MLIKLIKDVRETWHLAWPIAISQISSTGMAFVDTVMAGRASHEDLAAVSVGSSIWLMLSLSILGYLLAVSPMVAHQLGAKATKAIPSLVQQALMQALMISIAAFIFLHLITPIFNELGLEPHIAAKAIDFLKAISWSLPAFTFYRVLYNYSAALKSTKPMMIISIGCLLLNIPTNWILIYGHFGFPAMGGVGCGWATAFCLWVNFILLALWILFRPYYKDTHPFRAWQGWDRAIHKQLIQLGTPIGIMYFVEVSAFTIIALVIARLGAVSIAAHQITLNFTSMTFMIPLSIGTALTVQVGHAVGAKEYEEAHTIGQHGIRFGLCIAVLTGCLMIFCSRWIASFYTSDEAVITLAAQLLILAGIFQFSDITQVVTAGVLRGYKVTAMPMLIHMTSFWVIGMPLGYCLTYGIGQFAGLGVNGYWMALILALTCTALALQLLLKRTSKSLIAAHKKALHVA